jgi:hypothetical protein
MLKDCKDDGRKVNETNRLIKTYLEVNDDVDDDDGGGGGGGDDSHPCA